MTHLESLELRLSNERSRLASAKSENEIAMRAVWVSQLEKEVQREKEFVGLIDEVSEGMTDDELLDELLDGYL